MGGLKPSISAVTLCAAGFLIPNEENLSKGLRNKGLERSPDSRCTVVRNEIFYLLFQLLIEQRCLSVFRKWAAACSELPGGEVDPLPEDSNP